MRELNKTWRGENRPARILSFPQEKYRRGEACLAPKKNAQAKGPFPILGDLAIRADKHAISDRMLVHGVMHLLGYTHGTDKNYEKMRAKEKEVLAALKRATA